MSIWESGWEDHWSHCLRESYCLIKSCHTDSFINFSESFSRFSFVSITLGLTSDGRLKSIVPFFPVAQSAQLWAISSGRVGLHHPHPPPSKPGGITGFLSPEQSARRGRRSSGHHLRRFDGLFISSRRPAASGAGLPVLTASSTRVSNFGSVFPIISAHYKYKNNFPLL